MRLEMNFSRFSPSHESVPSDVTRNLKEEKTCIPDVPILPYAPAWVRKRQTSSQTNITSKSTSSPDFGERMAMIQKAIKQAGLPKCDLCDQIIASGAMPYLSENGVGLNVCLKCVQKAIRVYIQANGKKF